MIIIAYLYIINKHRNSWLYNILGLAANGLLGTSAPTVSCNNFGKYRRNRRLSCPLPVGQIYIFWPDGQRDGRPVPYGGNTGCADFFAYLYSITAVGIVGQSTHSAISIVTLHFADTLFGIILDCIFLFSPILLIHSFVHIVSTPMLIIANLSTERIFYRQHISKKFVAISLCFSIFFAADCAIWQTCFFIILSSVCCSML